MNKTVDFLSKEYDDFISQLQLINTRNAQQSVKNSSAKLRSNQRTPVTKQKSLHDTLGVTVWKHRASHPVRAIQATTLFVGSENLMAYKSQMAIFLLPILYLPSIPMLCQRLLSSLFEEMFAIGFTQIAESLWRRKRVCNLPDLDLEVDSMQRLHLRVVDIYSEKALRRHSINKEKKRHLWTQNCRIFIKDADAGRSFSFDSYEDLAKFRSSLRR